MTKRTMPDHIKHLRKLADDRKYHDKEAAEALTWAADMIEVSISLNAALWPKEKRQ